MKKVLIIGSINMDLVAQIDRFPNAGETIKGNDFKYHPGGKGANQASACVKQSTPTSILGKIGNDIYGQNMMKVITSLGIQPYITQTEGSTGIAVIEVSKTTGENRIIIIGGANDNFTLEEIDEYKKLINQHDIIVLQLEIPIAICERIAIEAKTQGKIVILNPAPGYPLSDTFLKNIDFLIPNEHELSIVSNLPTNTTLEIEKAMVALLDKGVKCVITTLGSSGYCYTLDKSIVYYSAEKVTAIDTTGAGDSFIGSFAAYYAKGFTIVDALSHASISASISVTRHGAFGSAGSEEEVKKIYSRKLLEKV